MKTILCYGDSNTWGYVPVTGARLPHHERWSGVMGAALGPGFHVVEEGLNSRTTVLEDPTRGPGRNGLTYLGPCLDSHAPLDLVLLMLGTNDLKHRFGLSASDIGVNISALVGVIQQSRVGREGGVPQLLLLAPPHVGPLTLLAEIFEGAETKSRQFARHYQAVAIQFGCHFFDTATVVQASAADGVHWDPDQHARLGVRLAELVRQFV